jgi:hypothetical protein
VSQKGYRTGLCGDAFSGIRVERLAVYMVCASVLGLPGCALFMRSGPPVCKGEISTPASGAMMAARPNARLSSVVSIEAGCLAIGSDANVTVYTLERRSGAAMDLLCSVYPPAENLQPTTLESMAEDGQYCVQITRGDELLNSVGFTLHAGKPVDVARFARDAGASVDELDYFRQWAKDLLMLSEGSGRVRVNYPDATLIRDLVEGHLEQRRVDAARTSPYQVQAYRDIVPFRFCCNRSSLVDKPVRRLNKTSLTWLRKKVPRAARRLKVRVISYASTPGKCEKNRQLSRARAYRVAGAMRRMGFRNLQVEWCGETGTGEERVTIDSTPFWQRVDVILPPELVTFRVSRLDANGKQTAVEKGTKVTVESEGRLVCEYQDDLDAARLVDLVILIDTSGSMADDWTRQISPYLGQEASKWVDDFRAKGIDAQVYVYTLNYNLCGHLSNSQDVLCSAITPSQLPTCRTSEPEESWGTGTSWAATNHPWRPGALRAVLPISDELPCEGNTSSTAQEDTDSLEQAVVDARRHGMVVYPYFGTLWGGEAVATTIREMMNQLADKTGGEAHDLKKGGDKPLNKVFSAITQTIESAGLGLTMSCFPLTNATPADVMIFEPGATMPAHVVNSQGGDGNFLPGRDMIRPQCEDRDSCDAYTDDPGDDWVKRPRRKKPVLDCGATSE